MNYTKQQLIADIKITDGVVHWNSYYYNLFDCKTQKEKDVVRNAVNRLRSEQIDDKYNDENIDKLRSDEECFEYIKKMEQEYKEESRELAIKIFFAVVAIAGVIYSYLHM